MELTYLSKIDMVTAALRELIMNGEFHAGDSLRQRDSTSARHRYAKRCDDSSRKAS
jgi:DNA-binding GntR family transcriptional regulator